MPFKAYDENRICYIVKALRYRIRQLDLSISQGSTNNIDDVGHFLGVIDEIDWDSVPVKQKAKGDLSPYDRLPGRRHL